MTEISKDRLREFIRWTDALLRSMDGSVRTAGPMNLWAHGGYKVFARKYMDIRTEIALTLPLPRFVDELMIDKIRGTGDTLPDQRKEVFETVYSNAALLKSFLEGQLGIVEDQTAALRDFVQARLRSAVFSRPEREREIQDCLEQLLIGRGLQKGEDYDREVGRVKVSAKEAVPDFVFLKLGLALEVKLVGSVARVKEVIDEINADIAAYAKGYRTLYFVVYDTGFIRDELEFRTDLERTGNVSVIVVKH